MLVARTIFPLKNSALTLTQRTLQIHGDLAGLLPIVSPMRLLKPKSICTSVQNQGSIIEVTRQIGPIERMLKKIGLLDVQKYRYIVLGTLAYENVMSQLDYPFFYKNFNMPDTLYSWFLITELHAWMLMVRYMAEGNNGKLIRDNIVSTLWEDTDARARNLGGVTQKLRDKQIKEISQQFNAAILGYDEGIQSDDKVLAGAIWRRFFKTECNNPDSVETLVIYIRKQICLLDNLPSHKILKKADFKIIDIKDVCKNQR